MTPRGRVDLRVRLLALAALILVLGPACSVADRDGDRSLLSVFAPSSMTDVMPELVTQFTRAHPDVAVEVTFAGSQILRLQIEQGAAADVFVSANESHMTALADGGHVARPRRLATTDLVIIVPLDNGAGVERFEDLTRAERIVSGTEHVPIGAYSDTVLNNASQHLGSEFTVEVRRRIVSEETNVRLIRAKVELGEADAAIVYRPDALASDRVRLIPIPEQYNVRAQFLVSRTARNEHASQAEQFLEFLSSPESAAILRAHGFTGAG